MKVNYQQALTACAVLAMAALAPLANGAIVTQPVTGWVVHNGTSTITDPGTDSPLLTPAGAELVVMAPFSPVELTNPGDYVTFTTKLTLIDRAAGVAGGAQLNTQLRFGLFSGPAGPVGAGDAPNYGLIGQYSATDNTQPRLRAQATASTDPFANATLNNLTNGISDTDQIAGQNPPQITYEITITRNAIGELDVNGAVIGGNHHSTFSVTDYDSAGLPAGGPFVFNRVGLWFGNNVQAASAQVEDALITTNVPEPQSVCLAALAAIGGLAARSRGRRPTIGN